MMDERNLEIILDAVAEKIRDLKASVMLKDMDNDRLREENKSLRAEVESLYAKLQGAPKEARHGNEN